MSLVSKLYVEDKEINILDFKFRFTRSTDEHGKPMGKPRGTIFEIIFETTSDQSFMSWAVATDMTKNVKIVVSPVTAASKSRVIELYDVHCVHFRNNFNAKNGEPMTTLIHLTPAIMIDDGYKILDHYWKKTDLSMNNVAPTVIKQDEELEIISLHFEDADKKKINEIEEGILYLVVETQNGIGKKIDIDLSNQLHNFKYEGKVLTNDVLKNISITKDIMPIELEIVVEED
ncbi:type VI secretion system tube protein TssD (plasmid) [Bernardetia sp. Wsw4-3y2]|uniref:type VI secretion system tube protein TssD n=1 Tax=unclassified Bernardetia TaxID=2647129 RepID=UPI0030CD2AED